MRHLYYASVLLLITCAHPLASFVLTNQTQRLSSPTAISNSGPLRRECSIGSRRVLTGALLSRALQLEVSRSKYQTGGRGGDAKGTRKSSRVLNLSGCPFSHIARDAFAPLVGDEFSSRSANASGLLRAAPAVHRAALAVRVVDLSDSRLERVAPGAFSDMRHVRAIRLSRSQQLRFVADGAFARLPALRVVDLSHSPRLEYLSPAAFQRTPQLLRLILRNCSSLIGLQVPDFIFHKAPSVSPLNVFISGRSASSNGLVTVDLRSSSGLLCKCELLALFASTRVLLNRRSQCTFESSNSSSPQNEHLRRLQLENFRAGRATDCDCTPHAVILPLGPIRSSRPALAAAAAAATRDRSSSASSASGALTLSARAGRRVTLACRSLEALNTSLHWSWRPLDRSSSVSRHISSSHNAGVLALRFAKLSARHSGFYSCTAVSDCGTHSSTVRLIVRKALRYAQKSVAKVTLFPLQRA